MPLPHRQSSSSLSLSSSYWHIAPVELSNRPSSVPKEFRRLHWMNVSRPRRALQIPEGPAADETSISV